ncbi:hypothetical protein D3C76_997040 [compost metagenome]
MHQENHPRHLLRYLPEGPSASSHSPGQANPHAEESAPSHRQNNCEAAYSISEKRFPVLFPDHNLVKMVTLKTVSYSLVVYSQVRNY